MVLSTGSSLGLPDFAQIEKIVAANKDILFVCYKMAAWYCEHLRSYQLVFSDTTSMCVVKMPELDDGVPLSAFRVQGVVMVTLNQYIIS